MSSPFDLPTQPVTRPLAVGELPRPLAPLLTPALTGGERDELEEQLRLERLITSLSARFVNLPPEEVDSTIEQGLRRVVEFLGVDRSTFIEFASSGMPDRNAVRVTHSYSVEGVMPNHAVDASEFAWCRARILRDGVVQFSSLDELPREAAVDRAQFESIGQKSNITVRISFAGRVRYAFAVGTVRAVKRWPAGLAPRLQLLGEIFASALARRDADAALREAHEALRQAHSGLREAHTQIRELHARLEAENLYLQSELGPRQPPDAIVANSAVMRAALARAEQVAATNATVLIIGETGTGKELMAQAIHRMSGRSSRAMIRVNCAALPAALIESELFGREKGAYTGALTSQIGRFELADRSTIFLDEVAELPLELQAKLLRVLQEGTLERLGSPMTIKVDVRVIAAANRDLQKLTRQRQFREDLYYRLAVFPITLPPLRSRTEDIEPLIWSMVREFSASMGKPIESISRRCLAPLIAHGWPGNVRELRNCVERAMILTRGSTLHIEPTAGAESPAPDDELGTEPPPPGADGETLDQVKIRAIRAALDRVQWRIRGVGGAAEILGIKPTTLEATMQKLGIRRPGAAAHV